MLKYIDKNGKKKPLIEYSDLCIEEVLDYGDKTLTCNVSVKCSVALEDIIRTRTDEYVIKQKSGPADDGTYTVTAKLNIDELEGTPFISFDTTEKTAQEAAQLALAGTGWTCECDVKKKRTVRMTNASSWEILKKIVDTYMLEMRIDSINKTIILKEKIGSYKGAYFTDQINLISLESQANTNDFYTRIYPIGKDGLTIESVNNGSTVLENHIYSSKNKTYIWKDERYTDPQSLKEDAAEKLADMAQPYIAYSCSILDLSQNSKKYKNYNIGDEVVLIDSFSKTKIKQRIKKISRYQDDPSKDTCEIANLKLTFTEMQQKLNDAADTVNNITTDNGTVDGSSIDDMDANKLTNVDDVVSKTESFKSIKTEVLTVTGELQSAFGKIGVLETNKLDSETARITYATIENLKGLSGEFEKFKTNDFTAVTGKVNDLTVGVEKVNTLMFGSASGGSLTTEFSNAIVSLIGDAQIKSAMIESIDAKKITALDINTTSMKVHSESGLSYWQDNTIVISDGTRTRVQLGKDASADYNMYIWDKAGNLMFDALGLTAKGIQREIIRNDMVSQDAGISAGKLDIGSLFEVINKDESHTLKSSKIYVDADNQTLDVSFKTITTKTNTAVEAANKATESADNALSTANSADAKAQSVVNRADSGEFKGDKGDQGIQGPKGDTGATGATGATGNGIKSIAEHYAVSASNASAPTSWSNTVPTMTVTNRYLWNYETITYTNNSVVDTAKRVIGVYGNTGETGIGVKQITPQYYLSTSNATQNGGSWSNTRPAWISGRYYWTRDYILWTDGSATYSTPQLATDLNNLYSSLKTVTDTVSYQGTQLSTVQGQISSKVWQQDITTAVTSLEIGGRNLLQGLKWCVKDNPAKTGNATDAYVYIGGKAHLENGKTYTLQAVSDSVWATGHGGQTGKATIWIHGLGDGFHRVFCGDGKTSGRYTWTFVHTSATQNCEIRINGYSKVTSFWNFKIESGNKATDWTPAPEDIDDSIVSVEGKVTTVSNQYTSLNQALTSLAATVNSNTTAISKKADGSTVTSLQNNITAIQADLGGFKTTVSNTYTTKTEFDELKIGGRNLAQKTNQGISGWRWTMQTGGVTATEVVESDIRTCKLTRDNVVQTGWSVIQYADIGRSKLETNTTYTISFDVKGSIDVSEWVVQLLHPDGTNPLGGGQIYINRASKANVWSKIVCVIKTYETFPTRTGQCLYLSNMPSGPGRWYQFRNVKIEKGNKATDWTPAPEDYSTTIEMNSAINQSANNVTAEVKGYTDTKLGSYATKASLSAYIAKSDTGTLKSCIEAIADDINLTAGGTINISGNKSVNISGNKFSLDSSGTKISSAGYLQTTNAKLGEWNVDEKAIYCKTADGVYTAYLQNPDYVVGETRENAWVYSVQKNGYRTFSVTSEGELYAKNILPVKSYEEINYRWTSYGNSTEEFSASWHFKGTGLLLVSCAIWTDETSDYGTTSCAIYINSVCVVANRHRYGESENSVELDAGCSFAYWFTDADITLQIIGGSTKDGLKTFTRTVQALFGLKEV